MQRGRSIRMEERRGYESRGELWSPGHFRVRSASATPRCHAGRVDRVVGDHSSRSTPDDGAGGRARAAPSGCSRRRPPARATAPAAELVLAADQFIITPAGRVEDAARARAAGDEVRTVIAGYHWFTDWGRDTMISLEGLTLVDGPARGGGLHPAHVRALRARRADPEPVPGGRERRASTTRPTRRCGSSTRSTATSTAHGDRATLRVLLPDAQRHRRAPRARHALRHRRRPERRAAARRARRAISSRGWTPRSTTGS